MNAIRRHPVVASVSAIVIVALIVLGIYLFSLAYAVDALPWQTVPTPYAGPAFQGIPGFGGIVTATPVP